MIVTIFWKVSLTPSQIFFQLSLRYRMALTSGPAGSSQPSLEV